MAKTVLGCSVSFCSPSLVAGPCCNPVVSGLCILPCWGVELVLCAGAGRGRVNPTQHSKGKESPFPFSCPHPAARNCLGCICPPLGAVDIAAALCWEG